MKKLIVAVILLSLNACAGAGIQGRLGLYREDTASQKSEAYDKPLKCLFVSCNEVQGS